MSVIDYSKFAEIEVSDDEDEPKVFSEETTPQWELKEKEKQRSLPQTIYCNQCHQLFRSKKAFEITEGDSRYFVCCKECYDKQIRELDQKSRQRGFQPGRTYKTPAGVKVFQDPEPKPTQFDNVKLHMLRMNKEQAVASTSGWTKVLLKELYEGNTESLDKVWDDLLHNEAFLKWAKESGEGEEDFSINWVSKDQKCSLLMIAIQYGNEKSVQWCIDKGAYIDRHPHSPHTPLLYACMGLKTAHFNIMNKLIESKADVNTLNSLTNESVIHRCAGFNYVEGLEYLLPRMNKKPNQLLTKKHESPLYIAARENSVDCMRILIKNGCNPHHPSIGEIATLQGRISALKFLLDEVKIDATPIRNKLKDMYGTNSQTMQKILPLLRLCANCKDVLEDKAKKCSSCKAVLYCSRECQQDHWKAGHRMACKKVQVKAQK